MGNDAGFGGYREAVGSARQNEIGVRLVRLATAWGPRLSLTLFRAHQGQEFVPGLLVVAEGAEHGAGDRLAVLLFHSAHLHAEVARFNDHAHALRADFLGDGVGDLAGHALLNLQAAGAASGARTG